MNYTAPSDYSSGKLFFHLSVSDDADVVAINNGHNGRFCVLEHILLGCDWRVNHIKLQELGLALQARDKNLGI